MDIIEMFNSLKDEKYKDFTARLLPEVSKEKILGVRSPDIKKVARKIIDEGKTEKIINNLPHKFHEGNMLHAYILGYYEKDIEQVFFQMERFFPYIDNWAICDSAAAAMKIFKKYPDLTYKKALEWIKSDNPFAIRFGIVTLLNYHLDQTFDKKTLKIISEIKNDNYYVKMAAAWYFSIALIKQYPGTLPIFKEKSLNYFVHNKAIQKALESYRVSAERKNYLKSLKITKK